MRYSFISAAILALTSSVFAQTANFDSMSVPTQDQIVAAGSTLDITWEPSTVHTGPITIQLLQGATPSTLEIGETITAGFDQTKGTFAWTVPASLKSFATYGFKITLDSTATSAEPIFQFSFPFHITGLAGATGGQFYLTSGTTTIHLSTGTYVPVPTTTSTSSSSSAAVNTTSTYVPSSTSSVKTTYSVSASTIIYPSSNGTVHTTLKPTATPTGPSTTPTGAVPTQTPANAGARMVSGGFAVLGGLVLAFAL